MNEINPVEFRKIVNMNKYLKWTTEECGLLSEVYSLWNEEDLDVLKSINSKLRCEELSIVQKIWEEKITENSANWKGFSVFAMIWWVLFWSLFFSVVFGWLGKK